MTQAGNVVFVARNLSKTYRMGEIEVRIATISDRVLHMAGGTIGSADVNPRRAAQRSCPGEGD